MENKQEKIIEKIKKVLELSKNNPSQEEARSAALKAQRLMAEYHISMNDIEAVDDVENIVEKVVYVGTGNKWKYALAGIVSENFRCKHFYYGKTAICFYGYAVDTEIASSTFEHLFKMGNRLAVNHYNKTKRQEENAGYYFKGDGIKNSFLIGFLSGIKEALDRQCTALMIVIPEEVKESYEKMRTDRNFKTAKGTRLSAKSNYYAEESYEEGQRAGRNAIQSNRIAQTA